MHDAHDGSLHLRNVKSEYASAYKTYVEHTPTSLCIREKLPNSFISSNFLQVCPFTLVIALSVSSGCVFHSCSWISFDIFF